MKRTLFCLSVSLCRSVALSLSLSLSVSLSLSLARAPPLFRQFSMVLLECQLNRCMRRAACSISTTRRRHKAALNAFLFRLGAPSLRVTTTTLLQTAGIADLETLAQEWEQLQ